MVHEIFDVKGRLRAISLKIRRGVLDLRRHPSIELVIREVFTSVEINDVQLVLAVVLLDIAKGLDSSANTHLDLLPDLVANRDQVLLLREQLHIFN